jgi:hypothetical protein
MKLKTIEKEAEDCRKAFENFKVGGVVVHCHHEVLFEKLIEPAINRINYILCAKPKHEQALRLRLFRPVKVFTLKAYEDATAPYRKAYEDAKATHLKAYEDAKAPHWKVYEDAMAPLLKAYEDATKSLHKKACHNDCPWDGKTIFLSK